MKHRVYSLHLGDKDTTRGEFLYREASHDPLTISFYFWVVLGGPEPIVYDVGFTAEQARERGVRDYRDRLGMLAALDLAPPDVRTVVMSHLHWDHWAGYELFDRALFHVQGAELDFWRGRGARHRLITHSVNLKALAAADDLERAGRLKQLGGERSELWSGLQLVPLPGHTPGLQGLLVDTERGPVMLASDALHFMENYRQRRPVQVTMNIPEALAAYDTIAALVGDEVVGGHDPADRVRFTQDAPGIYRIA